MYRILMNEFVVEIKSYGIEELIEQLPGIFRKYPVVVIRNDIPLEQSMIKQVARKLGSLHTEGLSNKTLESFHADKEQMILCISNSRDASNKPTGLLGEGEIQWHSDMSHIQSEHHGSLLYNVKNGHLACLQFCDTRSLLQVQSKRMKDKLRQLIGYHSLGKNSFGMERSIESQLIRFRNIKTDTVNALVSRSAIRETIQGGESVYLSPATLSGASHRFSYRDVLRNIQDNMLYKHEWQEYDIIIYDNLSTMHRRSSFSGERLLYRINFDYL